MKKISKRELLELVASLPDGESKKMLIAHLLKTGEVTEEEVASMVVEDVRQNLAKFSEAFQNDELLRFLWNRFQNYPQYLARALVRARPDLFYAYGFAFRLIMKLRANLGPVVLRPRHPSEDEDPSVFMAGLPAMVRTDIFALEKECRFREYLYVFSRDPQIGFEMLADDIRKATSDYERLILEGVRDYSQRLLSMTFPGFVQTFHGSPFPAFHVRWWIDQVESVPRVLNIGDTGTQKTAFATMAMDHYGSSKVLVLCTANARLHWSREISAYLQEPDGRVFLVANRGEAALAAKSKAQFIIVAYSTLIQRGVVETLKAIPFDGLIWDECQYGKNVAGVHPAQRAAACAALFRELPLKRLIALSATPWENHPIELGAVASALRPDVFPSPEIFRQGRPEDPRFLREFFAANVVEVELREIKDLPPILPKPWEDLFGAELIKLNDDHQEVYTFVRENDKVKLQPAQKVGRLLLTTVHPHKVQAKYEWPPELASAFDNWELSTKLQWLKDRLTKEIEAGAKVVVGTGIYAEGITRPENGNDSETWVGGLLKEWFGQDKVIVIDGTVSQTIEADGSSERDRLIQRWRSDPEARILLVSMRACPDSINLTVPALPGVNKLFVTTLSYPWVPWKQFLGRFWREGQGVPVEYCVPVLQGTIDESLLRLVTRKWGIQQLFRAQVPLTEEEMAFLDKRVNIRKLAEESRSDQDKVNIFGMMVQGRGEQGAKQKFDSAYGASTNGEIFARAFLSVQEFATSGHISRFMKTVIEQFEAQGLIHESGILDAGCGPLTLERRLGQAIHGIDMNPHMIDLARPLSPHQGQNARVGFLSQLPTEWTAKFELVVASLVLDWSSLQAKAGKLPERLAILGELVRVCHPFGRVWLTATRQSLNGEILQTWLFALQANGFSLVEELSGLVQATDACGSGEPFSFWSICFSPNGRNFRIGNPQDFRFVFETERVKKIRGRNGDDKEKEQKEHRRIIHQEFKVVQLSGATFEAKAAGQQAVEREVGRLITSNLKGWKFHKTPNLDWRTLEKLHQRGLLETFRTHAG